MRTSPAAAAAAIAVVLAGEGDDDGGGVIATGGCWSFMAAAAADCTELEPEGADWDGWLGRSEAAPISSHGAPPARRRLLFDMPPVLYLSRRASGTRDRRQVIQVSGSLLQGQLRISVERVHVNGPT